MPPVLKSQTREAARRLGSSARCAILLAVVLARGVSVSWGAVTLNVLFDDPTAQFTQFYDGIQTNLVAAGEQWISYVETPYDVTLEIEIGFESNSGANGTSNSFGYVGNDGQYDVWQQGAAWEILTGEDVNGDDPDGRINLSEDRLLNDGFWFDPSPTPSGSVPSGEWDGYSVLLHEFGHVLSINGWRDWTSGQLPEDYQSTFDRWVIQQGDTFFFDGPAASEEYGGPVPLTYGNLYHLANNPPRPGTDLTGDLMNGLFFNLGQRYSVSPLDLAILSDTGFQLLDLAGLPGDANLDGQVDIVDFNTLKSHFGGAGDRGSGDFNDDGQIDISDFSILKEHFGQSAAIPEPCACLLAVLGAATLLSSRFLVPHGTA
jgi:hypothetical protein